MMKNFANAMKFVIASEMAALFIFTDRPALDIVMICMAQYSLFFAVDASIIIKNIKSVIHPGQ